MKVLNEDIKVETLVDVDQESHGNSEGKSKISRDQNVPLGVENK